MRGVDSWCQTNAHALFDERRAHKKNIAFNRRRLYTLLNNNKRFPYIMLFRLDSVLLLVSLLALDRSEAQHQGPKSFLRGPRRTTGPSGSESDVRAGSIGAPALSNATAVLWRNLEAKEDKGCWKDAPDRALPYPITDPKYGNSIQDCIDKCDAAGYAYSGRQWKEECWCGAGGYDKHGPAEGCDCNGDNIGAWIMCVWGPKDPSPPPPPPPTEKPEELQVVLTDNAYVFSGGEINFPTNDCQLKLEWDGKLVVYRDPQGDNEVIWSSGTGHGDGNYFLIMQGDGNLAIYRGTYGSPPYQAVYASNSVSGHGDYFLGITSECRLVIHKGTFPGTVGEMIWSTSPTSDNPCSPNPCYNGGACEPDGSGGYVCTCSSGYTGTNCETPPDDPPDNPCSPNPCYNGGTCDPDGSGGYACTCVDFYSGTNCENSDEDDSQMRVVLADNEHISSGQVERWFSPPNDCQLAMHGDGKLVVHRDPQGENELIWSSGTGHGDGTYFLIMQGDGNLVIYRGNYGSPPYQAVYASNSVSGHGDYFLGITSECRLVIHKGKFPDAVGEMIWSTPPASDNPCSPNPCYNGGTCEPDGSGGYVCTCSSGYTGTNCETPPDDPPDNPCSPNPCYNGGICDPDGSGGYACTCVDFYSGTNCENSDEDDTQMRVVLADNEHISSGKVESWFSPPNDCQLAMHGDGKLVVHRDPQGENELIWSSGTGHGDGTYFLIMQGDGNLVIYRGNYGSPPYQAVYASNSVSGHGDYFLGITSECRLVIHKGKFPDAVGEMIWSTPPASDNPCSPNPCYNGGTCEPDGSGGYVCTCSSGYTGTNCETPPDDPPPSQDTPLVLAYYYPWYIEGDWTRHSYVGTPLLGEYGTDDPSVAEQHIAWALQGGIDALVMSWWGPDALVTDHMSKGFLQANNINDIKFTVIYESLGRLPKTNNVIDFNNPAVMQTLINDFMWLQQEYFGHPSYLKVSGRPVVVLYVTRGYRNFSRAHIQQLEVALNTELFLIADEPFFSPSRQDSPYTAYNGIASDGAPVFEAYTTYNMFVDSIAQEGESAWDYMRDHAMPIFEEWSSSTVFFPQVFPSYHDFRGNKVLTGGVDGFKAQLNAMRCLPLQSNTLPRMLFVTSFNEWWEGTTIEPASEYGSTYLEALKENKFSQPAC